ncbi:CPBP family intramembrane glutamic endopeptidase [Cecembia calidifontis]|uniref:CAAX prenyl protease-like protein n=1 Tax=Cecembia calidifontis TaxID=1187080 RepID=A0A4Q7P9P2_9BACT|nr:CPBP family intramembrane glutamic endopeptidase [Cecembia calidifontis]RZS95462.1 CAAX prenyl protease-like protein [Cecembia calidifontis]
MKLKKFYLGISLFFLGLLGILSMLTVDIPLPEEMQSILEEQFTPSQIQWLLLINPTIIMLIAVIVGVLLYQKINLSIPIFEKWLGLKEDFPQTREILVYGIVGGLLTGVVLSLFGLIGRVLIPSEFEQLTANIQLTLAARFLYGGITEEILMRFGLMTFLVWIASKISKGTKPSIYWLGIILAALIFAVGHFPMVFQVIGNPSPIMIGYVLLGNSIGGLVFGWLYWKKGLESAFLAHMFAHVGMVVLEKIFL